MSELKPCPICGSSVRISDLGGWEVLCNANCGVVFELPDERHIDREATIAAWNRRATDGVQAGSPAADAQRNEGAK